MGLVMTWVVRNLLLILTIVGVIVGIFGGGMLRYLNLDAEAIRLIGFPGELFMNMLKAAILPLIVASLISGLSQLDLKTCGKLGITAVSYYLLTTIHAVLLGIVIVTLLHPGDPRIKSAQHTEKQSITKATNADNFLDLLRNLLPENLVRATFQQQQTIYTQINVTDGSILNDIQTEYHDGINVLGLITFCIAIGLVISQVGKPAKPLADFFNALDIVITRIVFIIMWFGPIGIPSLIAQKMLEVSDLMATARILAMFIVTVVLGLAIQCFITLPLIYFICTQRNPFRFLQGLAQAVLTALGTASSAATLPITFQCLHKMGVDSRVTKFVLPVGAIVNMDGTALYEATASIFIAQMNGMELPFGKLVTVSITATLASIGAASIPSAGLVTMMIVLTALGLPVNDIPLILAIDWLLDRLRTSVNVVGDAFGCGFVYHVVKAELNLGQLKEKHGESELTEDTIISAVNHTSSNNNNHSKVLLHV